MAEDEKKPRRFGPTFLREQGAKRLPRKPATPKGGEPKGVVARNPVMPPASPAPDMETRKGPVGAAAGVVGAAVRGASGPKPHGFSSAPARGSRRAVSIDQFIAGQQALQDNPLPGPVRATHQRALKTLSTVGQAFPTTENPAGGGSTVNRHILIAVIVITGVGALAAVHAKRPVTRVVVGGVVLLIVLSILDAFGGVLSTVAGSLATLAMVVVLLVELPALLPILQTLPDPASLPAGTPPGGGGSKGVK